ncbi:cell adhesion molecule 4-like [Clarias gariepinus]|uniref:hemicentin-2-like n=1 Tax=Clarias gariepinus TaxID=13013 RepID=UPI00234C5608|nr:hemicentin-2-like [Clarias gariepinus]
MALGFSPVLCLLAGFLLQAAGEHLVLSPPRLVVEYGAKATANCSTNITHEGMGWEASQGPVDMNENVQLITWTVERLTHWDIKPYCFINSATHGQQKKELPVVIYKRPDTTSISLENHTGYVIEGKNYTLKCDIKNVAPVQYLKVMWYKHQSLMKSTSFTNTSIEPLNSSDNLMIRPSRNDNGAVYWCEAQLELGPDGPQPPLSTKSNLLLISVHYKPMFSNNTETIEKKKKNIVLNCTAQANPSPTYSWDESHSSNSSISISDSGNYTCKALNDYGEATKVFIVKQEQRSNTTFWAIVGSGIALAVLLIAGYAIYKIRSRQGPSSYRLTPSSEGQTLPLTHKGK